MISKASTQILAFSLLTDFFVLVFRLQPPPSLTSLPRAAPSIRRDLAVLHNLFQKQIGKLTKVGFLPSV